MNKLSTNTANLKTLMKKTEHNKFWVFLQSRYAQKRKRSGTL
ncbi:hypothetical protein MNBD_GAMMA09-2533 [hydrothermal vent metagenome]|uniref:Uncharacterized protein n=1 Tax=hydrothermal vent metagenome TaxID=652676 RepID=A0A3B0XPU6_9ZZZZ